MKKEQLHEEISSEEKAFLPKRKWLIWVACGIALAVLCLVVAAVVFAPEKEAPLPPPANGNWTVNFIQEQKQMNPQVNPYPTGFEYFGSFYEDLNEQEIKTMLPKDRPEWMSVTGKSRFDRHGVLWDVELEVSTTIPNQTVYVSFRSFPAIKNLERVPSEDDSICNGVVYRVFERPEEDGMTELYAVTVRQLFVVTFKIELPNDYLEQGKQDFKQILESFTYYGEKNKPNWSKITYEYIPEHYRKKLTLEAAREDPEFGALIPQGYPLGETHNWYINHGYYYLALTEVSREKDYYDNYLRVDYGGIFKGRADVTWQISYFDENIDTRHLVHIDEDWESLRSPIFYIEEMTPENLYAVWGRDRTDRIHILLKCGDYLVSISANADVDPFWVRYAVECLYMKF